MRPSNRNRVEAETLLDRLNREKRLPASPRERALSVGDVSLDDDPDIRVNTRRTGRRRASLDRLRDV